MTSESECAPFILAAKGDLVFFKSLDALTRYVEAPDLPSTQAFDATGYVVRLTSEPIRRRFGFVSVPPVSGSVTSTAKRDELREILKRYVVDRAALADEALEEVSLEELLERAVSIAGYMR